MKNKKGLQIIVVLIVLIGVMTTFSGATAVPGDTTRLSAASDGSEGDLYSYNPSISGDGRYVAFESDASNLVTEDTNEKTDVFVRDRLTGGITRVSVDSDGLQGNDSSFSPSISWHGRYVAFASRANNLVNRDYNGESDIFVHDRQTGETTLVSMAWDGSESNNANFYPNISGDGRYVSFESYASSLVQGDTNDAVDVFVHDRQTGNITRVSVASDDSQAIGPSFDGAISGDGRYVAFTSYASNLVAEDTNGQADIFVHELLTGETILVSLAWDGSQGNDRPNDPSISYDGRYVTFSSSASNLVEEDTNDEKDIFVHDRQTGEITLVSVASDGSQGDGESIDPFISAYGRYVAFESFASTLVSEDTNNHTDIYIHDRQTGETTLVSVASDGSQGDSASYNPVLSAFGRFVAFDSYASDLVPDDSNHVSDVFLHETSAAVYYNFMPLIMTSNLP